MAEKKAPTNIPSINRRIPPPALDFAYEYPGPLLILAGPGTGKTHSLAKRIRYLIEEKNVPPKEINAITFSGEAAANLRARLNDESKRDVYLPVERQPLLICTMHSLGHQVILRSLRSLKLCNGFKVITDSNVLTPH